MISATSLGVAFVLAVVVLLMYFSYAAGEEHELLKHRRLCACRDCKRWRQQQRDLGKEPTSEEL